MHAHACAPVCVSLCVAMCHSLKKPEALYPPRDGITGVVSQLVWVLGTEPGILEEQFALLAAESSLQLPREFIHTSYYKKGILVPFSFEMKLL